MVYYFVSLSSCVNDGRSAAALCTIINMKGSGEMSTATDKKIEVEIPMNRMEKGIKSLI